MARRKSSRVHPKYKTQYHVRNWREYEAALRAQGDIMLFVSKDVLGSWKSSQNGLRGGQFQYSDLAVVAALALRLLFHLPFRQTEGFVGSLFRLMGVDLKVPDHTTLSRRSKTVRLPPLRARRGEPLHLIVDSTGLKISGSGEWHSHKHKGSKRCGWFKLHLGVDAEGYIVAQVLTDQGGEDGATGPDLIRQVDVPIDRFTADGMYDRREIYEELEEAGTSEIQVVIPPRSDAVDSRSESGLWSQCDAAVRQISESGRRIWERESGYRQQSRVENTFFRYKRILGGHLHSRDPESQKREVLLGCHLLSRMLDLGRSDSRPVVK